MKIETTPFEGVASQGNEMSRAEREHRLWMQGYPHKVSPKARIWTRSEVIEILREINELTLLGTLHRVQTMHLTNLDARMRQNLGFRQFFVIEDPQPGDFL